MQLKAFSRKGFAIFSLLVFVAATDALSQKLTPTEIIAKHIASVGKNDLIAQSKRLMVVGSSEFVRYNPEQRVPGKAVLASDGNDLAFFSTFESTDFPMERIGLFSDKVNIPTVKMGSRSPLGGFLKSWDKTLDSRIFGGIIFSTWRFFSSDSLPGKFETDGKKKIGDRDVWVLNYTPKGGLTDGSYIKLYFDAENFHHLRTVYRQKEPEGYTTGSGAGRTGGVSDWNADMANNASTLTEDFEDFRSDIGLVLPHKYSISLVLDGATGTGQFDYNFTITQYRLIKDFPLDFFSFKTV